ncbi:23S rRNA pseudouridylate synthase B, partial [Pseudidiomarina aestuarii]
GGGKGANSWFHVVIQEGRNREVRRLWESQGVQVSRLVRLRYGPVIMPNKLKPGRWMMLEGKELEYLYEEAGLKTKTTKRGSVEKVAAVKDVEVEKAPKSKWPDKPAKKASPRSRKADDQPAKRGPRIRGRNDR